MGLEMIGFARANIDELWIDPTEYADELREAVTLLDRTPDPHDDLQPPALPARPRELWPWTVSSISDWKNEYHPECLKCGVREQCGGFFFSAKYKVSENIHAISPTEEAADPPRLLSI